VRSFGPVVDYIWNKYFGLAVVMIIRGLIKLSAHIQVWIVLSYQVIPIIIANDSQSVKIGNFEGVIIWINNVG